MIALKTLEKLSTKIEVSYPTHTMKPASTQVSEFHWVDLNAKLPFTELEWSAINDLLGRAWFERLWIWQEIRLANQDAIITCGYGSIPWEAFRSAIYCLYMKEYPDDLDGFEQRVDRAFELCDYQGYNTFLQLAEQTKLCKYTDPKDRVYALLSMVAAEENPRIEPDYTKSLREIYQDLFIKDVEHSKDLRLLQSCELQKSSQGIPTWVTDWSSPRSAPTLKYARAAGDSQVDICFPREGTLRVTGLHVATIQQVDVVRLQDGPTLEDIANELRRLASQFSVDDSRVEVFCRTACMNLFCDSFHPPREHLPDFHQLIRAFHQALHFQTDSLTATPEYLNYYLPMFVDRLSGRSFFPTHGGYFGLAPLGARENDLIYILLRYSSAMTLRPTRKGQYQVVGGAYCHGFMSGETLLGPLPGRFEIIFCFTENYGQYIRAYIDRDTGKTQVEDPRLGLLPVG
jgi:hypothetical protein